MAQKIHDPEFGTIDTPPPPEATRFEKQAAQAVSAAKKRRNWPAGTVKKCPRCNRDSFVGRNDLTHRMPRPGAVLIFRHLKGARCEACGAQSLEPVDQLAVEHEAGITGLSDYEAKVTAIGSGTLGTYWPKDVVRNLGLQKGRPAYIQILDNETALIRFPRESTEPGEKKTQKKNPPPTKRRPSASKKRSPRRTTKH